MTLTNDDVIQLMRTSLKREGKMFKIFGFILLVLPLIFIILIVSDVASGSFSLISKTNIGSDAGLLAFVTVIALPGIFLLRNGIRKSKPENNKVYTAYIQFPEKITQVYEEVINNNCCVVVCADKSQLRIDSNIRQYRMLSKFIKSRCVNASSVFF